MATQPKIHIISDKFNIIGLTNIQLNCIIIY